VVPRYSSASGEAYVDSADRMVRTMPDSDGDGSVSMYIFSVTFMWLLLSIGGFLILEGIFGGKL